MSARDVPAEGASGRPCPFCGARNTLVECDGCDDCYPARAPSPAATSSPPTAMPGREELGRVAYEAYHAGDAFPPTPTDIGRERWCRAAEAVRTAVLAGLVTRGKLARTAPCPACQEDGTDPALCDTCGGDGVVEPHAWCEGCLKPIHEGDPYEYGGEDNIYLCAECSGDCGGEVEPTAPSPPPHGHADAPSPGVGLSPRERTELAHAGEISIDTGRRALACLESAEAERDALRAASPSHAAMAAEIANLRAELDRERLRAASLRDTCEARKGEYNAVAAERDALRAKLAEADDWPHVLTRLREAGEEAEVLRERNAKLENDLGEARSYLLREGYRSCDTPACNCGSYHPGVDRRERSERNAKLEAVATAARVIGLQAIVLLDALADLDGKDAPR